ncbi:MAG: hypothetical protein IIT61_07650, partial [Bacteroidales bacterium]|nr:hypothetical protein [Bacteroidales bacterium]
YSLPREWSLDNNGLLQQKPYSGLTGMRQKEGAYSKDSFQLNGTETIPTVTGRQVEVCATFQRQYFDSCFHLKKMRMEYTRILYQITL